jgi:hypothetical protein
MRDAQSTSTNQTPDDSGEFEAVERWVDTNTAAQIIGFKEGTLRNWRSHQKGPPFSVAGGNPRYRVSDLHAWMQQGRAEASSAIRG